MATQQRSTTFTQESTRPITQVGLYARVSTLNNQDPEMQLAELRMIGNTSSCWDRPCPALGRQRERQRLVGRFRNRARFKQEPWSCKGAGGEADYSGFRLGEPGGDL